MKDQSIITFAILSLFTIAVPSANADTSQWGSDWRQQTQSTRIDASSINTDGASLASANTTVTKESASSTRVDTSVKTESASITEVSDTPVYAESLKRDEIIEKHKHHVLLSDVKRRPWL
jgi:hypothetical protein